MNRRNKCAIICLCSLGGLILAIFVGIPLFLDNGSPSNTAIALFFGIFYSTTIFALVFGFSALFLRKWVIKRGLFIEISIAVILSIILCSAAIPNLMESKIQPSGSSAAANLRLLSSVQLQYSEKFGTYGTLEQLCNAGYIDSILGSGVKQGYSFHMIVNGANSWCCIMRPVVWGEHGEWNFMIATDGVIYVNREKDSTEFKEAI